jgi:hypothetical protein
MRRAEDIEQQIRNLPRDEYARLREWFLQQDAQAWDNQFEADVHAGKLDALGAAARRAHVEGKTTKL